MYPYSLRQLGVQFPAQSGLALGHAGDNGSAVFCALREGVLAKQFLICLIRHNTEKYFGQNAADQCVLQTLLTLLGAAQNSIQRLDLVGGLLLCTCVIGKQPTQGFYGNFGKDKGHAESQNKH